MSTTVRKLVSKGFREAGIIGVGDDPDGAQFEEGIELLQGLYDSLFGNELGEHLENINYGTNGITNYTGADQDYSSYIDSLYVPANVRLMLNVSQTETLHLLPSPLDGTRLAVIDNSGNLATFPVTLDGNGRQIEGAASVILNTNSLIREWFYRADLGQWAKVTDLVAEDISPLPRAFDDMLSTALAIRINPRYGAQTAQETGDILTRAKNQFRSRYHQKMEQHSETALIRLPSNRFWRYTNNGNAFNRGKLA